MNGRHLCNNFLVIFLVWWFGAYPVWLSAQPSKSFPPNGPSGGTQQQQSQQEEPVIDTVPLGIYFAGHPEIVYPFADTSLLWFRQYDPTRRREWDYAQLGNLGTAHTPIVFQPVFRRGLDIGLHQYDLYKKSAKEVAFYRMQRPVADLFYSQGPQQSDLMVQAQFARNFAKEVQFVLDYGRISQLGQASQYPNQNTRNTALAGGWKFQGWKGKYRAFLTFAGNTIDAQDNGGVDSLPLLDVNNPTGPQTAEVASETAQTRHQNRELSYTHFIQLTPKKDSLGNPVGRSYLVRHRLGWNAGYYKFFDESPSEAPGRLYGPLQIDDRGLRHYLEYKRLENEFNIGTLLLNRKGKTALDGPSDLLEVGVAHTLHWVKQEPAKTFVNNLFLTGEWQFHPIDRFELNTYAHLGLLGNAGDYRLSGSLNIDLRPVGRIQAFAISQAYEPTLLEEQLYVNQRPLWEGNFKKTFATTLGGLYQLPALELELGAQYHLLNNYVYFDTTGIASQTATPTSILQLTFRNRLRVWRLHFDNWLALQQTDQDALRLPLLFGKHSFYYEGRWFKRVFHIQLGLDLRYTTAYYANFYQPLTGQFQLQNNFEVPFYPAVDAFATFQVGALRGFIKQENVALLIHPKDPFYYQVPYYAQPYAALRFGLRWLLRG